MILGQLKVREHQTKYRALMGVNFWLFTMLMHQGIRDDSAKIIKEQAVWDKSCARLNWRTFFNVIVGLISQV